MQFKHHDRLGPELSEAVSGVIRATETAYLISGTLDASHAKA